MWYTCHMLSRGPRVFGTAARTKILVAIALLEESYPREIARITALPLVSVQRAVNDFDADGVTASRMVGQQRNVRLNPRYFAGAELRALLVAISPALPQLVETIGAIIRIRTRPIRSSFPRVRSASARTLSNPTIP